MRMHKQPAIVLLITLLLLFSGCAPTRQVTERRYPVTAHRDAIDLEDASRVKKILYRQADEWRGVPYRMGGLSKKGIDCSGFVYVTFLSKFGIRIPRSTELQAAAGYGVIFKKLTAGDLVFFRTGVKTRHVGIYVEKNIFLHASTSGGVMLSRLSDAYWRKNYWKSVRIKV
jgi:cell wall-associated NlpC family hydrolase